MPVKNLPGYFNLEHDLDDFGKIHETIERDMIFRGTNLWILVFAIVIASVGLNMNSTAVIIGAMLISPLMGPINGMGYGIATYNFPFFRKALKNFGFAVAAGLTASTLYFTISPVSEAHSEILARTSPTIYDVLIALFGGMAGIMAISSRLKGNVLPGVAIATALMPPLCTAGYGLASAQLIYFIGAFYLFVINAVFIAISSVAMARFLKFPEVAFIDVKKKKRVHRIVTAVIILTVVPSVFFGYGLVQNERFTGLANRYIQAITMTEGSYLLKSDIFPRKKEIHLVFGGAELSDSAKQRLKQKAVDYGLEDVRLVFEQGFSFRGITREVQERERLMNEVATLSQQLGQARRQIDSTNQLETLGKQLLQEMQVVFPRVTHLTFSETREYSVEDTVAKRVAVATVRHQQAMDRRERSKAEKWLGVRTGNRNLRIFFEQY